MAHVRTCRSGCWYAALFPFAFNVFSVSVRVQSLHPRGYGPTERPQTKQRGPAEPRRPSFPTRRCQTLKTSDGNLTFENMLLWIRFPLDPKRGRTSIIPRCGVRFLEFEMPQRLIAQLRPTDCRLGFTWYVCTLFPTSPACNLFHSFSPVGVSELFLDSLGCKVSILSHPPGVTRPGDCASIIWIVVFPMPTRVVLDETRGKGAWHRGRNGLAECSNRAHSPGRGTTTPCEGCPGTRVVAI